MLANLAAVLQSQGRIKEARQALEECVFLEERSLPGLDPVTLAHALNNLALLYQTDSDLIEAARLLKRAASLPWIHALAPGPCTIWERYILKSVNAVKPEKLSTKP